MTIETSTEGDVYIVFENREYHISRHASGTYHQKINDLTIKNDKRKPIEDMHGAEWLNTITINIDSFTPQTGGKEYDLEPKSDPCFIVDIDRFKNAQVTFAILTEAGIIRFEAWANNFREESHHIFRELNPIIGVVAVRPQSVKNLNYDIERLKRTMSNP